MEPHDVEEIERKLGVVIPPKARQLLFQLVPGEELELEPDQDASGLGASLEWMTAAESIEEAVDFYPGIAAIREGLVPIGKCLVGSGDPYFLRLSDNALVRVPHDAIVSDHLDCGQVEPVGQLEPLVSQ